MKRSIVESLLDQMGIEIRAVNDYGYRCLCPFHSDSTPSFSVNRDTGGWKCFAGCGGGSIYTLMKKMGMDIAALDIKIPKSIKKIPKKSRPRRAEILYYCTNTSKILLDRGFSKTTLETFNIGFDTNEGETIFPVQDERRQFFGYIHSPGRGQYYYKGDGRDRMFFGQHNFRNYMGPTILVEGPTDVLRLWELKKQPAVALMGAAASPKQIEWIRNRKKPVWVFLDNDQAGIRGMHGLYQKMRRLVSMRFAKWPNHLNDVEEVEDEEELDELFQTMSPFPPKLYTRRVRH